MTDTHDPEVLRAFGAPEPEPYDECEAIARRIDAAPDVAAATAIAFEPETLAQLRLLVAIDMPEQLEPFLARVKRKGVDLRPLRKAIAPKAAAKDATTKQVKPKAATGSSAALAPAAESPRPRQRPRDDAGTLADVPPADLARELLILYGKQTYVLRASGEYSRPLGGNELAQCWERELAWAVKAGILEPNNIISDGDGNTDVEPKSLGQILREYGTVVQGRAAASMVAQRSYYDPATEGFTEAICRRRDITPAFDERVDTWLRKLGGPKHAGSLLDWIATLIDLSRPTSILVLIAPAGAGKTMLAHGLARLWTDGGPVDLEKILGNFNSGITECPLVFADEGLPKAKGRAVTSELRRIFSGSSVTLSRKFMSDMVLRGALRGIVAANNHGVFDFGEELTEDDIEAIGVRFLHIDIPRQRVAGPDGTTVETSEATEYLKSIGGRAATDDWVTGDRIAAHALWLAANRTVTRGTRFLVEGQSRELVTRVAVSNGTASNVCEWMVRAILDEAPWRNPHDWRHQVMVRKGGKLYVSAEAFVSKNRWETYIQRRDSLPSATAAGRALNTISHPGLHRKIHGTTRFRSVRVERLAAWAEMNGIAPRAMIEAWAKGTSPEAWALAEDAKRVRDPEGTGFDGEGTGLVPGMVVPTSASDADGFAEEVPGYRVSSQSRAQEENKAWVAGGGENESVESSFSPEPGNPVPAHVTHGADASIPVPPYPVPTRSRPAQPGTRRAFIATAAAAPLERRAPPLDAYDTAADEPFERVPAEGGDAP